MSRRKPSQRPKQKKQRQPSTAGSIFNDTPWYEDDVFKIISSEWFLALLSLFIVMWLYKATV